MEFYTEVRQAFDLPFFKEAVAFAATTAYAAFKTYTHLMDTRQRRRFEFISKFFADKKIQEREPIEVEQAFWHYIGRRFEYPAIREILRSGKPLTNFFLYASGAKYIEYSENEDETVVFSLRHKKKFRFFRKVFFGTLYTLFGMLFFMLLLNSYAVMVSVGPSVYVSLVVVLFSLGALAYFSIDEVFAVKNSEEFVSRIGCASE